MATVVKRTRTKNKKRTAKVKPSKVSKRSKSVGEMRQQLRRDLVMLSGLCYATNAEWAVAAGVCESTVSRFVNGTGQWHRDSTIYRLALSIGAEAKVML